MDAARIKASFEKNVVPTYARFDIVLSHGEGRHLWDMNGKRYLDFAGGIAVSSLGHNHPDIVAALAEQAGRLMHVSNLYYFESQARLAEGLVGLIGPGKMFFCNSGVEANEGLFKLARRFGQEEGRFEIITALNSFHGRTLAGIAATGQEKVKKGFSPAVPGFRHVPFNDFEAVRDAISPATVAVLIESIQGEGGITSATPEYLLALRRLCDERKLLLLMDGIQDGHFRTGCFQGFQRILEDVPGADGFLPDGIAMAKSMGAGYPIGAFWIRAPYADILGAGSHGTTYGGSPLACAAALKVLEVVRREGLAQNARQTGQFLKDGLQCLAEKCPRIIRAVRGLGLIIGMELRENIPAFAGGGKSQAVQAVNLLHEAGLMSVPAGTQVLRFLPPLNLKRAEAEEGLNMIESVVTSLASS